MPSNYFISDATARRYADARPNLNALFNDELLRHTGRVSLAADVGCGTGMSTRALAEVADIVYGLDPSLAMLSNADPHPRCSYCAGVAEAMPFADHSVQLVTAGLALHWFHRDNFFSEVERVLVPDGCLFVYNTWFAGRMVGEPRFGGWLQDRYLKKYPVPPRDSRPLEGTAELETIASWTVEAKAPMSSTQLALYLTTQSNVTAVVDQGEETLSMATTWLESELSPIFRQSVEHLEFAGNAWLLQRTSRSNSLH